MKHWKILLMTAFSFILPLTMCIGSASAAEDGLSEKQRDALVVFINAHSDTPYYTCLRYRDGFTSDGFAVFCYTEPLYSQYAMYDYMHFTVKFKGDDSTKYVEGRWSADKQAFDIVYSGSNISELSKVLVGNLENSVVYTNHNHYDADGNLFFQKSPLLGPMASALATQGALEVGKIAEAGGVTMERAASSILCLMVLAALVIKLVRSSTAL